MNKPNLTELHMKYKKTKIAFLTAIAFFAILTVYPPAIDSYIVRAIDQKATQIGSDLRYDSIRQKWERYTSIMLL